MVAAWPRNRRRRNRRGSALARAEGKDGAGRSESQMAERNQVKADIYDAYRAQIEHEDELIGMRNGWLIGGQSFLFAAYAATLAVQGHGIQPGFSSAARELFYELPALGIALAVLAFITVSAALVSLKKLKKDFDKKHEKPEHYPPIMSEAPRHFGHGVAMAIPILFVASWVAVFHFR